jgi:hypothetical protein
MFTSLEGNRWRPQVLTVDHIRTIDGELSQARDAVFPKGYFANLPWQLMLDLDNAARAGRPFPFSGEGYAMPSVILRRLRQFEADGYVERRVDPADSSRELAVLTPVGQALLNQVFQQTALSVTSA